MRWVNPFQSKAQSNSCHWFVRPFHPTNTPVVSATNLTSFWSYLCWIHFFNWKTYGSKYNQMRYKKWFSVQIISTMLCESCTTSVHDVLMLFLQGASKDPTYELLEELINTKRHHHLVKYSFVTIYDIIHDPCPMFMWHGQGQSLFIANIQHWIVYNTHIEVVNPFQSKAQPNSWHFLWDFFTLLIHP